MNTGKPEFRSPDLTQYTLSCEHDIRCPKCGAGSNCIVSHWTRGKIELKCICGWISELFVDRQNKISRSEKLPAEVPAVPAAPIVPDTIIKRCRKCRETFEIPTGAKGLYCIPCRKKRGLPARTYEQQGEQPCHT